VPEVAFGLMLLIGTIHGKKAEWCGRESKAFGYLKIKLGKIRGEFSHCLARLCTALASELMLIWRDGGESRVRIRENSG
jgi:hypothetical protein